MLRQEGRPTSNISAFVNARDYLLAHRNDYNRVLRDFSWPRMDKFNWALDYFDVLAADNIEPALIIVEEDGIQRTRTFAELARRSNQMANFLGALGVLRGDHILVMLEIKRRSGRFCWQG